MRCIVKCLCHEYVHEGGYESAMNMYSSRCKLLLVYTKVMSLLLRMIFFSSLLRDIDSTMFKLLTWQYLCKNAIPLQDPIHPSSGSLVAQEKEEENKERKKEKK